METLPKFIISYIALFLNATNTLALRLVCKKFSTISLNRFRLKIKGFLSPGKYDYIYYIGHNSLEDLKNCIIRKLWLVNDFRLDPMTILNRLVLTKKKWSKVNFKKLSDNRLIGNYKFKQKSKEKKIVDIDGAYYIHNNKNMRLIYHENKTIIPFFKKIKCNTMTDFSLLNTTKLELMFHTFADLTVLKNLTHLKLFYASDELKFPPNLKVLKLIHASSQITIYELPEKLEKLKIKDCGIGLINSICLPRTIRWYKLVISPPELCMLKEVPSELNIRYIVKAL